MFCICEFLYWGVGGAHFGQIFDKGGLQLEIKYIKHKYYYVFFVVISLFFYIMFVRFNCKTAFDAKLNNYTFKRIKTLCVKNYIIPASNLYLYFNDLNLSFYSDLSINKMRLLYYDKSLNRFIQTRVLHGRIYFDDCTQKKTKQSIRTDLTEILDTVSFLDLMSLVKEGDLYSFDAFPFSADEEIKKSAYNVFLLPDMELVNKDFSLSVKDHLFVFASLKKSDTASNESYSVIDKIYLVVSTK